MLTSFSPLTILTYELKSEYPSFDALGYNATLAEEVGESICTFYSCLVAHTMLYTDEQALRRKARRLVGMYFSLHVMHFLGINNFYRHSLRVLWTSNLQPPS